MSIDPSWYHTYWYGTPPHTRRRHLQALVGRVVAHLPLSPARPISRAPRRAVDPVFLAAALLFTILAAATVSIALASPNALIEVPYFVT